MSTTSTSSKPSGGWQPPTLEEMQAMLPQYQFECLLGRGGMGAVYKAVQVSLDRPVAIKVLPVDLIDDADSQFAERFKNEARTMARMNHPSIVDVYDFGETQTGLLYIVMEFINGTDVAQMIAAQGKLPEDYALSITAHVCDALNYAHRNGVIHRDIKPANILINMEGAVKVADFGLAKQSDAGQSGLTKTNMAMGTPDFVAPEALIPGIPLDGRADLYAIGVMLYQMLTGEIPRGIWSLPGTKLGTDPRFDAIITKAMQTDREVRYQSAADLRRDLDTILTLPRAALVAQQQAAAEATARATQAQKQAASGPQRRSPTPPAQHAPPPVKKSSLGPIIGIAATVVLLAGLVYVLKPPARKPAPPVVASTSEPSDANAPAPMPESASAPTPAPAATTDSAGFSHFAPTAQWRDELAGTDAWGPAWKRAGGEMHVVESKNTMRVFADLRQDSGLRVRFRSQSDAAWLDLIQRLNKVGIGPRYVITVWTKEKLDGSLDLLPLKKDGDRRTLAPLKSHPPLGTGTEHTAELYAIGDRLTFFFDGQLLSEVQDTTFTEGFPGVYANHGIELIRVETAVLDPQNSEPPPTDVLTFGGHRYQFSPEKLTWEEAKAKAAAAGGHLVTITSAEENQWVLDTFVTKLQGNTSLWLGGTNDNPTRQWTWITGEPFTFTAWAGKEPGGSPDETALCFLQQGRGWGDIRPNGIGQADRRGGYLIEWNDAGTQPMPAPVASSSPAMATSVQTPAPTPAPPALAGGLSEADLASQQKAALLAAHPLLAKLESGFRSRFEADAQKPFLTALAALNQSYVSNGIAKARAAAQAKGDLKGIIALDAEKTRVEKNEGVPAEDDADTPDSLKTLRGTYRAVLARHTAERDARAAPLYDVYVKALDAHIADLTKADKLDEAQKVKALRDDIAATKPQIASAAAVTKPAAPASTATAPPATTKPATTSGSTWRTAADFLVSNGGSFVASKNGVNSQVLTAKEIPSGRFDILELNLDRLNSVLPPLKTQEMAALNGLRDLRRVNIRPVQPGLEDAAFAFLAGNDELNWLNLEGVPDVTDAMLPHLAPLKKLEYLAIQYATKFTGQGLDKIAGAASITTLEFLACEITDEGMKAISTFKKLQSLRVTSPRVTTAGFAAITGLKTLTSLTLSGTAFDDEAVGFISAMTGLTNLDLGGTKITDAGLARLKSLKKLTALNLGGTAVSLVAAAEFQKNMPQCRVNR
ncbi:MAG TPA: hypothetical protein DDZ88_19650 [Verrucomicrobiales bacterium]|nr:hypothetical protein [Verrucomicrobiales bacterium]